MKLHFLGTNGWYSSDGNNTVCTLAESRDYYLIFDAGDGIHKLERFIKKIKPIYLFLSHLHYDHIYGFHILPKFNLNSRLKIICPQIYKKYLLKSFNHPFAYPLSNIISKSSIQEINERSLNRPFFIESKKLFHIDESFGYRIQIDGKTVAYCTDTGYCQNSVILARNADILIHECSNPPGINSGNWGHSNPADAATVAKKAKVKKLILTHFGANQFHSNAARFRAQAAAKKVFPNTTAATDNLTVKI